MSRLVCASSDSNGCAADAGRTGRAALARPRVRDEGAAAPGRGRVGLRVRVARDTGIGRQLYDIDP